MSENYNPMEQSNDVDALLWQGHNLLERGQFSVALERFQQAAALAPKNAQVLSGLGLAFSRLEQYREGLTI